MATAVETVFGGQTHRFGLFVRTIGLAKARTKIGLANLAYNLKRFLWDRSPAGGGLREARNGPLGPLTTTARLPTVQAGVARIVKTPCNLPNS